MAQPEPKYNFSGLVATQDELDRENNEGAYKRDDLVSAAKYYTKMNVGGFTQNFVGNPDRLQSAKDAQKTSEPWSKERFQGLGDVIESVTPNAIPGIYNFANLISRAGQEGVHSLAEGVRQQLNPGGEPIKYKPFDLPGSRTAERMVNEVSDKVNEVYGVESPESTQDVLFGVLPQLAVPGPALTKAKTLLGKAGNVVGALTIPLSQSKPFSAWHALEVGVPLAISEGAAAIADPDEKVFDSALRGKTNEGVQVASADKFNFSGLVDPDGIEDMPYGENPESDDNSYALKAAAATTLTAAAGYVFAKRFNLFHPKGLNPNNLAGETPTKEALPTAAYLKKGFLDKHVAPTYAAMKVGSTKAQLKDIEAQTSAALNPVSKSNIKQTAIETGVFPGMGGARIPRLSRILRTVGKFRPVDHDLYDNTLKALDLESRMKVGQVITDGNGKQWSRGDFLAIINQAQNTPPVWAAVQKSRAWHDGMRNVLVNNGIIDTATAQQWAHANPFYIHTQLNKKSAEGIVKQAAIAIDTTHDVAPPSSKMVEALKNRAIDPQDGVLPGQGSLTSAMMKQYAEKVTDMVLENNYKKYLYDHIMSQTNNTGGGIIRKGKSNSGDGQTSHWENGKEVHYNIDDQALHNTLLNQPALVVPVLNTARSMIHFWATGAGNPFWVTSAATYDTLLAPIMRMNGDSLGPLDEIVRHLTGGKLDVSNTIGIDPSAILNWPVGSVRYLYGAFVKEMGDRLESSLNADRAFARSINALGLQGQAHTLLQVVNDAYMRSNHYAFNSAGGGTNSAMLSTPENMRPTMAQDAPELLKHMGRHETGGANPFIEMQRLQSRFVGTTMWRSYTALMNALHTGVKFQAFAANNVRKTGQHADAYQRQTVRAAKSAKELTVDSSRTGDNKVYRTYASSAVYGNVGVQALYQMSRAIADHPWRFATTLSGIGFAYTGYLHNFMSENPAAADYYFKTLTPTQRIAQGLPLYVDERGDMQFLKMDPQYRPMTAVATELYGALMGHTDAVPRDDEQLGMLARGMNTFFGTEITEKQEGDITTGALGGLVQGLPGADIPAANFLAREMGFVPQNNFVSYAAQRGQMYREEHDSYLSPDNERTVNAAVPKLVENLLTETFGQVGRNMVESVNTFSRVLKASDEPLTAVDAVAEQYGQAWKDSMRGNPIHPLWISQTNDKKIDTFNEIARRNTDAMKGMDEVLEWGKKGLKGNTTGGALPMELPGTHVQAAYQELTPIISAVEMFKAQVKDPRAMITNYRKILEDVETSPLLSLRMDEKRARVNELRIRIIEQQHILGDAIQNFEDGLSKKLGRTVRFADFDPEDWINEDAITQKTPLPR